MLAQYALHEENEAGRARHSLSCGPEQRPALQVPPERQRMPHPPQWLGSVRRSRHAPLQRVCPLGQAHAPATQVVPLGQRLPHAPQWLESVEVSTQVALAPHGTRGAAHSHTAPMQDAPAWQGRSHAPQCASSLRRSAQRSPHHVVSVGQVGTIGPSHAPCGWYVHALSQVSRRVWSGTQPSLTRRDSPGLHSPSPSQASLVSHAHALVQRSTREPQRPHSRVRVAPGAHSPSSVHSPYSHTRSMLQKRSVSPQLPQATVSSAPGVSQGSSIGVQLGGLTHSP